MNTYIYRSIILVVLITCWTCSLVYGQTSLSLGVRYDTFADDRSPEGAGNELTIPFGAEYQGERLSLRIESAYSRAIVDHGTDPEAEIASMTDTLLAGSYLFPDLPVGVIVGVDVNLPTGKEQLRHIEQAAEAGERHDLWEVDDFGEGLNVGLNLGLVKELGPLNMGLNGAYIVKMEYNPTEEVSNDDFDPGDQALLSAVLRWKTAPWVKLETTMAYSYFFPEKTNGKEAFQEGEKITVGGQMHIQCQPIAILLGMQSMVQGKSKEIMGDTLRTESDNSNGAELFGWVDLLYRISPKLDLQVLGDIRNYGESDRKNVVTDLPFQGHRIRYAAGPGVTYLLNTNLSWNAVVKYFVMEQERDMTQEQDVTFQGMNISVGITYTF
jgi:hypothetical protein